MIGGIRRAQDRAAAELGVQTRLILCFLRDLSADSAMQTMMQALPYKIPSSRHGWRTASAGAISSGWTRMCNKRREGAISWGGTLVAVRILKHHPADVIVFQKGRFFTKGGAGW